MNEMTKLRHQLKDHGEATNDMWKEGQNYESPYKLAIHCLKGRGCRLEMVLLFRGIALAMSGENWYLV